MKIQIKANTGFYVIVNTEYDHWLKCSRKPRENLHRVLQIAVNDDCYTSLLTFPVYTDDKKNSSLD